MICADNSNANYQTAKGSTNGSAQPKLLLVEDDLAVQNAIRRRLAFEGFEVATSGDGLEALTLFEHFQPDLLIADVMLPGMDGLKLTETVRERSRVPILLLSAKDAIEDRVRGLERGADDYMVKPFELPELLARIRAMLRRATLVRGATPEPEDQSIEFEDLRLDPLTREVTRAGHSIELTPREFALLEFFMIHPTLVLTRDQIIDSVWGHELEASSNLVDVYVRHLRNKTEIDGLGRLLHTVRGIGYVLKTH